MKRQLNLVKNFTNWPGYLVWKHFTNRKAPFCFKTVSGLNIVVPPRLMHTFKECFFREVYLENLALAVEAPVVVDIGANTGFFSLYCFHKFPKAEVHSFEPIRANFELLKEYKQQFTGFKWNIYNKAVSSKEETLKLFLESADQITTSASIKSRAMHAASVKVSATTIPAIFSENHIDKIHLLKLDCEGAEYDILYSLPDEYFLKIDKITMETHDGPDVHHNKQDMISFLQGKGYNIKYGKGSMVWAERL